MPEIKKLRINPTFISSEADRHIETFDCALGVTPLCKQLASSGKQSLAIKEAPSDKELINPKTGEVIKANKQGI